MGRKKKEQVDWKNLDDGYEKYQAYLKSKEWDEVKALVYERDKVCRCCGRSNDQAILAVHHSQYNVLYNEKEHLDKLILLCNVCHCAIHRAKSNYCRFRRPAKIQNPETVKTKMNKKINNKK